MLFAYRINKTLFFNNNQQNRRIGFVSVVILGLIIVLLGIFFLNGNPAIDKPIESPAPLPVEFDYFLDATSGIGNVLQGNSVNINLSIFYLQGDPENITLIASGIPVNADYTFSKSSGFPTNNITFNSVLTIYVSKAVPTDSYLITINSTAENGKSYSFPYTLFVLGSGILVSGRVDGGVDVIPTEIMFRVVENSGEITNKFTALIEDGNYAISLFNHKFYYFGVRWEKLDGSSGIHYFIQPFRVNEGVGVTSKTCSFSFSLPPYTD